MPVPSTTQAGSPLLLVGVACATFVVDRVSKYAVALYIPLGGSRSLPGGLVYIDHAQNAGAAFSLAPSLGNLFLVFALIATVAIVWYYRRVPRSEVWTRVALGMILGGALGNALDRVVFGSVTDFIDLRFWPVFNLADSAIVVGAVILAWRFSVRPSPSKEAQ
ncbi:MAG TPA: signal peptidase II [Candidatus Dormibacteraeota bacterium]|jgi:signal peptidase II|nr:signal peptidase II [Candidatus Dormibacteraeota bacterium]